MADAKPCASCGTSHSGRSPFCSDYCKAVAEFVRLCRRWLRDPAKQSDPDYPYVLQVRLAFLHTAYLGHGGVYDEAARQLSDTLRASIWERDQGRCVECGEAGAEIDHIYGSSDDPSNLQLLCRNCHHAKTRESISVITDPADLVALASFHAELTRRVEALEPINACDNEQTWSVSWRSWPDLPTKALAYEPQVTSMQLTDIMRVIASSRDATTLPRPAQPQGSA